ncbi:MAG: glycosyltransferase [gamma proteobacterium symbiont of Taylorina sp.]|nr:glycosyltransferase [gamma proteobacterium symbiont of Taylorina sp.]
MPSIDTNNMICSQNIDKNYPLLTVITVVYNGEKHIEQTVLSVLSQTYRYIEYIIIDGNSIDNTLNIINLYEDQINCIISEPDNGISDAMNKGVLNSCGDFLIFLHADDYFYSDDVLQKAVKYIDDDTDILLTDIQFGKELRRRKPRRFNFWMNFKTGVFHQGSICSRKLFNKIGNFDEKFKIAMDYDFFLRAFHNKIKWKYCPIILSVMRETGVSSQIDCLSLSKRFAEEKKIHEKNSQSYVMELMYLCYWLMYLPYRKLKFFLKLYYRL